MISYTLSDGADTIAIEPTGKGGLKAKYAPESGQKFNRAKLSGSLVLSGEHYRFAEAALSSCCGRLTLKVEQDGAEIVKAIVSPYNVDFNPVTCRVELSTFVVQDGYTAVFENWQKVINVLDYVNPLISFLSPDSPAGNIVQTQGRDFIGLFNYLLYATMLDTSGSSLVRPTDNGYSQFYESATNPVDNKPNEKLVLLQLSDAVRPDTIEKATKGNMTLKDFLEAIRTKDNVFWDISPDGYFRLEHRMFYDLGGTYVYPTVESIPDWSDYSGGNSYKYVDENTNVVEQLTFPQNEALQRDRKHIPSLNDRGWVDFIRGGIRYERCQSTTDTGERKEVTLTCNWITDYVMCTIDRGNTIGFDGWVLVGLTGTAGSYQLNRVKGAMSNALIWNGNHTAANLFYRFHRWGRSFLTGIVNEQTTGKGGVRMANRFVEPNKEWSPIQFSRCNVFGVDISKPVRTRMSPDELAFIQSVDWDFSRGTIVAVVRTGGLCYTDPKQWLDVEPTTQTNCPVAGQRISTATRQEKDPAPILGIFGVRKIRVYLIETFTDGSCGTYTIETQIV